MFGLLAVVIETHVVLLAVVFSIRPCVVVIMLCFSLCFPLFLFIHFFGSFDGLFGLSCASPDTNTYILVLLSILETDGSTMHNANST